MIHYWHASEQNRLNIRPTRWWYLLGVMIAFGGGSAVILTQMGVIPERVEMMHRVVVPGSATFIFKPGNYVAYYEPRSIVDGKVFSNDDTLDGLFCGIRMVPLGMELKVFPAPMTSSYSTSSFAGVSVFRFTIKEAGSYQFACERSSNVAKNPFVIAVGNDLFRTMNQLIAPVSVLFLSGVLLWLFVFIRRRRSAQRLAARHGSPLERSV